MHLLHDWKVCFCMRCATVSIINRTSLKSSCVYELQRWSGQQTRVALVGNLERQTTLRSFFENAPRPTWFLTVICRWCDCVNLLTIAAWSMASQQKVNQNKRSDIIHYDQPRWILNHLVLPSSAKLYKLQPVPVCLQTRSLQWDGSAVVYALLGKAVTEYRWGGLYLSYITFLIVTVKKWLKLVYIYGSCHKIKLAYWYFGPLCRFYCPI